MTGEPRVLRSGPLTVVFGDGDLRHVRLGGTEVLQRVYVGVRDRDWGTIPGRIENLTIEESARSFSVSFDSVHQEGEIDFRWHAALRGDETGKISFTMDGKAHGTFLSNRISLCVLHPSKGCAGRPCTIEKPDGSTERSLFPEFVAPHQPFLDIRAMTHEVQAGVRAQVRFTGEVFETEDQRNWTDASYKTYAPPLRLPFPVEVKAGTRISQSVELSLEGDVREVTPPVPEESTIELTGGPRAAFPALGLCLPSDGTRLSDRAVARLRQLRLSHVCADLRSSEDVARAGEEAERLGLRLEAAVAMPSAIEDLGRLSRSVKHWLVFDDAGGVTTPNALAEARRLLGGEAVLAGGTDGYFVELNRDRLPGLAVAGACFSIQSQVHAVDDDNVMANTAGQSEVVRSAKRFLGAVPVIVSPVTLGPRHKVDPRQKDRFCAAWTVASLKHLAEAGAASVTYFEAYGPRGVQNESGVFPVYQIFEWLAEFAGGEVIPCRITGDAGIEALVLAAGAVRRMLVANLTDQARRVRLNAGTEQSLALEPYSVEHIDWTEG